GNVVSSLTLCRMDGGRDPAAKPLCTRIRDDEGRYVQHPVEGWVACLCVSCHYASQADTMAATTSLGVRTSVWRRSRLEDHALTSGVGLKRDSSGSKSAVRGMRTPGCGPGGRGFNSPHSPCWFMSAGPDGTVSPVF